MAVCERSKFREKVKIYHKYKVKLLKKNKKMKTASSVNTEIVKGKIKKILNDILNKKNPFFFSCSVYRYYLYLFVHVLVLRRNFLIFVLFLLILARFPLFRENLAQTSSH